MKERGFTLIELLVVVAVIGLLSAIILASFQTAREKSRDARRMSDMRNYQNALGMYSSGQSGIYPIAATPITITGSDALSTALETSGFLSEAPVDPLPTTYTYSYSATTGVEYVLSFCLETDQYNGLGFQQGCGNTVSQ